MSAEILKAILDWNPWLEGEFPEKLLGIKREYNILSYLKIEEIKILVGARRVGKSTLLYKVIKHGVDLGKRVLYLNFQDDILENYSLSEVLSAAQNQWDIDYLLLDEIQNCINWVSTIRKLYDTRKLEQIWLSGSNAKLIKQEYTELLTGRNLTLNIQPLNFREFLAFHHCSVSSSVLSSNKESQVRRLFAEYLQYGSFPAVVLRQVFKKELLQNYFHDFLFKDIATRHQVNTTKLKTLAIYLATNSSKLFSYRKIAASLNLHTKTVEDYFYFLLETYLIDVVYKFDPSLQKQYSQEKKVYMIDPGLAQAVSFRFSRDLRRTLENLVYCALKREEGEVYFHKEKRECDFIVKRDLSIVSAYQVTASLADESTIKREKEGLLEAMTKYNLETGTILTQDEEYEEEIEGRKILIRPIWRWLLDR